MNVLLSKKQLEFALRGIEGKAFRRQGSKLGYDSYEKIGDAYFVRGLSFKEIASELDITQEYARAKVGKIKRNLMKNLKDESLEIQVSFVRIERYSDLNDEI